MSAPTPSSQARVGSEKKAHGAARSVQTRASPKDRAIMAPMSQPNRRRARSRSETMTMSGQKR